MISVLHAEQSCRASFFTRWFGPLVALSATLTQLSEQAGHRCAAETAAVMATGEDGEREALVKVTRRSAPFLVGAAPDVRAAAMMATAAQAATIVPANEVNFFICLSFVQSFLFQGRYWTVVVFLFDAS